MTDQNLEGISFSRSEAQFLLFLLDTNLNEGGWEETPLIETLRSLHMQVQSVMPAEDIDPGLSMEDMAGIYAEEILEFPDTEARKQKCIFDLVIQYRVGAATAAEELEKQLAYYTNRRPK